MDEITIILIMIAAVIGATLIWRASLPRRSGIQPLTNAGPKPGQKLSNIRAARPRVRPTARRMRSGGSAYMLRRNDYATDLLFLIALDAALDYDEMHYGLYDFVDSPFINDDFDYGGSDFEDYAEVDSPDRFDSPPPPVEESAYEAPEAETFEDLSSEDDTLRSGWGGSDDGGSDDGGSDWGGSDDSGGGWDD